VARRHNQEASRVEPGGEGGGIRQCITAQKRLATPQDGAWIEAAEHMGGEAQRRAVMGSDPAGCGGARLDLMQGAGQQPAFGQQRIDRGQAERDRHPAGPLDTMGALQPADLLA